MVRRRIHGEGPRRGGSRQRDRAVRARRGAGFVSSRLAAAGGPLGAGAPDGVSDVRARPQSGGVLLDERALDTRSPANPPRLLPSGAPRLHGMRADQSIATVTRWVSGRTCSRTDGDIAAQMPRCPALM